MAERIALIDFGAGNLKSVHNALIAAGASDVLVTDSAATVRSADRTVLPGVGAFGHCMTALAALPDMVETLHETVRAGGQPFLGICVGMQMMVDTGEEHGRFEGLGWIAGSVQPLAPSDPACKVPHMGWNDVTPNASPPLLEAGEAYFLHGYGVETNDPADVLATSDHGGPVTAAIGCRNMIGVQFHPEKSQRYGLKLLERFLEWKP